MTRGFRCLWFVALLAALGCRVAAADDYYRHTYFDNSLTSDAYFYSSASATAPSVLAEKNGKLPVETKLFFTPPNALRLAWQSQPGGGWDAGVHLINFRNRYPGFVGDTLSFWCYSSDPIAGTDLPLILLANSRGGLQVAEFPGSFTEALPLGKYIREIPAGRWVQIHIPLGDFESASIYPFESRFLVNIIFHQGRADGIPHTLIVDEIRIDNEAAYKTGMPASGNLAVPQNVRAKGYDRHIEVSWDAVSGSAPARYTLYRSMDGSKFEPVGIQRPDIFRFEDFLGKAGVKAEYKVTASDASYRESGQSAAASATTREMSDDELLTMLQEACFHYYWDGARSAFRHDSREHPGGRSHRRHRRQRLRHHGLARWRGARIHHPPQGVNVSPRSWIFSNTRSAITARGRISWMAPPARPCPSSACSTTAAIWWRLLS